MRSASEENEVRREFFRAAYARGAPWDIGRPQRAFVGLWEAGAIAGEVLEVGCGFAENSLFLASKGLRVCGVDMMAPAINRASTTARERGLDVELHIGNALDLARFGLRFDTVIDSGLLHVFTPADRAVFVTGLANVLRPGGLYHALYFREGPRAISPDVFRSLFGVGWRVKSIAEAHYEERDPEGARAWLATVERMLDT
jgi:2-polyprenyl-3-methyl-5-hydroxy-6-metoxy-1,4-benzoquinol methylase